MGLIFWRTFFWWEGGGGGDIFYVSCLDNKIAQTAQKAYKQTVKFTIQGLFVRKPINTNLRLMVNLGFHLAH